MQHHGMYECKLTTVAKYAMVFESDPTSNLHPALQLATNQSASRMATFNEPSWRWFCSFATFVGRCAPDLFVATKTNIMFLDSSKCSTPPQRVRESILDDWGESQNSSLSVLRSFNDIGSMHTTLLSLQVGGVCFFLQERLGWFCSQELWYHFGCLIDMIVFWLFCTIRRLGKVDDPSFSRVPSY